MYVYYTYIHIYIYIYIHTYAYIYGTYACVSIHIYALPVCILGHFHSGEGRRGEESPRRQRAAAQPCQPRNPRSKDSTQGMYMIIYIYVLYLIICIHELSPSRRATRDLRTLRKVYTFNDLDSYSQPR